MRRKRKVLAGLASLTLFDLAAATAPGAAQPAQTGGDYQWAGLYIGGNAGYRLADVNFSGPGYKFNDGTGTVTFPPVNQSYHSRSGIVGSQIGYNLVLIPAILAGWEADWDWAANDAAALTAFSGVDTSGDGFTFHANSEVKLHWQSSVRGRLGIIEGPVLFYATGGVAFIDVSWHDSEQLKTAFSGTFTSLWDADKVLTGVVAGGGMEYLVTSHWIARIEYLHERFNGFNVPFGFGPQIGTLNVPDVNKIRFAVSYKFGP